MTDFGKPGLLSPLLICVALGQSAVKPPPQNVNYKLHLMWRDTIPGHAKSCVMFWAEFHDPVSRITSKPRVRITHGRINWLAISPDRKRIAFYVDHKRHDNTAPLDQKSELRVSFKCKRAGTTQLVDKRVPLHLYSTGTLSVGAQPVPKSEQDEIGLSGGFIESPGRFVASGKGIRITTCSDEIVGVPLGQWLWIKIEPLNPKGVKDVTLSSYTATSGSLMENGDGDRSGQDLLYFASAKDGTTLVGVHAIKINARLRTKTGVKTATCNLKVRVLPDGTCGVIIQQDGKSNPIRIRSKKPTSRYGRWVRA